MPQACHDVALRVLLFVVLQVFVHDVTVGFLLTKSGASTQGTGKKVMPFIDETFGTSEFSSLVKRETLIAKSMGHLGNDIMLPGCSMVNLGCSGWNN